MLPNADPQDDLAEIAGPVEVGVATRVCPKPGSCSFATTAIAPSSLPPDLVDSAAELLADPFSAKMY